MKKAVLFMMAWLLCLCFVACSSETTPENPEKNSHIVVDESTMRREERLDDQGNQIGYYTHTRGTNDGVYGIVRIEYLDMEGNVLHTIYPKTLGATLVSGSAGTHYYEITGIAEQDKDGNFILSYELIPYTCGKLAWCQYYDNGNVVAVEVYDQNQQVAARVEPSAAGLYMDAKMTDTGCYIVREGHFESGAFRIERKYIFDSNGRSICHLYLTNTPVPGAHYTHITRIEVKKETGETIKVYELSEKGETFEEWYGDHRGIPLTVYETNAAGRVIMQEIFDPAENSVIFRESVTYNDSGVLIGGEVEICGGKAVVTMSEVYHKYEKIAFYDAAGVLQKTVDAGQNGGYLEIEWEHENYRCRVDLFDSLGKVVSSEIYKPNK